MQHYRDRAYVDHNAGRTCSWCRQALPPYPYGGSGPPRSYCNQACKAKHCKAKDRRRRKAIDRGATVAEAVDVIEVFETAEWRCARCGVDTPRSLMGFHQANSPELDHIIALSLGGDHVRANVQLLCRACNRIKARGEWEVTQRGAGSILRAFRGRTGGEPAHAAPRNANRGSK